VSSERPVDRAREGPPSVLVVDDDRRVLELLEVAFSAHGFKVWTAVDGDEAIKKAHVEHPDLLVLDVRLPKRSGLEVCEAVRRDPEQFHLPIILVSAASETEARVAGLQAGADDYLAKPFSPKELIARSRRLLARSAEGRDARRRTRELERELHRAQDEARRSLVEAQREQRLRELAYGPGRDLSRTLDVDEVARRFLLEVQSRLGVQTLALLLPGADGELTAHAVRGDGLERFAALSIPRQGPLATLLLALGRPALERELERLPELRPEVPPLVACGAALIAPLVSDGTLEGLLVTDERADGRAHTRLDAEMLLGLCDLAGAALATAQRFREQLDHQIELLVGADARGGHSGEAWTVVDRAARATLLPPRLRAHVALALAFGARVAEPGLRVALERLAANDPTRRITEVLALCDAGRGVPSERDDAPEAVRAAALLDVAGRLAAARRRGTPLEHALEESVTSLAVPLDPATLQALRAAAREAVWLAGSAA